MKKLFFLLLLTFGFSSEGWASDLPEMKKDSWNCKAEEMCYEGVIYVHYCYGMSVKFLPNGKVATCNPKGK